MNLSKAVVSCTACPSAAAIGPVAHCEIVSVDRSDFVFQALIL